MNNTPTNTEPSDELDRLLSDFFKGELKKPWPKAPMTPGARTSASEPSELAAARAAEAPRNQPRPANRDNTARARFTLAASVALMLGTCWYMSDGFQPGEGPVIAPPQNGPGLLNDGRGDGKEHLPLQTIKEDRAKGSLGGPPKMDMGQFE